MINYHTGKHIYCEIHEIVKRNFNKSIQNCKYLNKYGKESRPLFCFAVTVPRTFLHTRTVFAHGASSNKPCI